MAVREVVVDDFDEDDPDNALPLQHTWLARILRRLGADFPEYYWPAVWYLGAGDDITVPMQPDAYGWELTLCVAPTKWTVGLEFESETDHIKGYENWKDASLHIGPFIFVLHRWWLHG